MLQQVLVAALGGVVGAALTAVAAIFYAEVQRRRERSGVRAQIVFLLRQLAIHMAMTRDYPKYYRHDVKPLVARLIELSLTPPTASGLTDKEQEAIFEAIYQTDQDAAFLDSDRQKALEQGNQEYVRAAGQRSFQKLQAARSALGDGLRLVRPVDPRALHNWRAGDPITGSGEASPAS